MKRVGFIYEKIISIDNLNKALDKASYGKKDKRFVKRILENRDYYIQKLHDVLESESYVLSENLHKTITEKSCKKQRELTIAKFYPDQILHWAVCLQLQEIFMKSMYFYNCGSVPGRGAHKGKKYIEKIIKDDPKTKYVLKLDIRKFFPNVCNEKLKSLFRTKLKDPKALRLIDAIIDQGGKGLPIGYYTSQWFSNFYLEKLDHYIKQVLGIRHYIRYVDDMVLLDTNRRKLHKARIAISEWLKNNGYKVEIKGNWQLWKIHTRPLDFLGFRFYKDKTLLRKRIFFRLSRYVRDVQKKGYCTIHHARAISALLGWMKHIPSGRSYYLKNVKPIISKKEISKIISAYDRKLKQGGKNDYTKRNG